MSVDDKSELSPDGKQAAWTLPLQTSVGVHNLSNSPYTIGDLPQELFVKILQEAYLLSKSEEVVRTDWTNPYRLVCRRWRDVICSTPRLWEEICATRNPEWLEFCLARCSGTLVTIDVRASTCSSATLATLCRCASSLRECRASFDADDTKWLSGLLRTPMPSLEILTVSGLYHRAAEDSAAITHDLVPRLTTLNLRTSPAPRDTAIYASLRRLTLFDSFWMSSYADFLNVIGTCRALEYLSLANKIFYFFEYDLQVLDPAKKHQPLTAPVVLPQLRFLKLWGPTAVVFRLLAAIHAPKVAKIRFGSDLDADEDEYGPDVARLLAPNPQKRYPFLSSPTIISIRCWNAARFGVCLRNELTSSDLLYHLERRTGDHSWDPYLTQNLTAVVDIFPVASINTLIVEGSLTGVSANVWKRIFLAFSGLREVYLKGRGTLDTFWLGLERATLASVEDGGAVCCPSLSEITSEGRPSTRYKFAATTGLFDIIRGALGTRAEQGSRPLKKLKLDLFYAKDVWEQTVERRDALVEDVRALVGELEYRELRMDA